MRVVVNENMKVFHGHVPVQLDAGQEVSGELAALLARSARSKVTVLDEPEPEAPAPQVPPAELDITANAADVLAWVGEDPERAAEALEAEQAKDKPRSTLVAALTKLAG